MGDQVRTFLWVLAGAALCGVWGCRAPAVYEAASLPRFLVDPAPENPPPAPPAPPVVPVDERPAVTLADAVSECVLNNMRLRVGEERVRMAQADFLTESLIPNCQLMVDAQLLPITAINAENQAGPPQYDAMFSMPIDWFVFGKRVASQAAARANIDVAQAEFADLLRREIALTVDGFYDALEADMAVKLSEEDIKALQRLEETAKTRGNKDAKSDLEGKRVSLAILDMQRELRKRRAAAETTKAKLQARIGRPVDTPDFVVRGTLAIRAVAPLPKLTEAWAMAEQYRPDLIAARRAVTAAQAALEREKQRAYPQVSVSAGVDYQDQVVITGFRNAWLYTTSLTTTLPLTDRNQGRIRSAEAALRAAHAAAIVATAEARAELEQAIAEYTEAMNGVTGEDIASLETAREVRDKTLAAYRKGDKDLVDALDAERAYRDRLRNTLGNLTDYWQALNRVNAAIGARVLSAQQADRDTLFDHAKASGATPEGDKQP